jgi:hypothetical protein
MITIVTTGLDWTGLECCTLELDCLLTTMSLSLSLMLCRAMEILALVMSVSTTSALETRYEREGGRR